MQPNKDTQEERNQQQPNPMPQSTQPAQKKESLNPPTEEEPQGQTYQYDNSLDDEPDQGAQPDVPKSLQETFYEETQKFKTQPESTHEDAQFQEKEVSKYDSEIKGLVVHGEEKQPQTPQQIFTLKSLIKSQICLFPVLCIIVLNERNSVLFQMKQPPYFIHPYGLQGLKIMLSHNLQWKELNQQYCDHCGVQQEACFFSDICSFSLIARYIPPQIVIQIQEYLPNDFFHIIKKICACPLNMLSNEVSLDLYCDIQIVEEKENENYDGIENIDIIIQAQINQEYEQNSQFGEYQEVCLNVHVGSNRFQ